MSIRVQGSTLPTDRLVQIQVDEKIEPAFVDRAAGHAAAHIAEDLADVVDAELNPLHLEATTLAAPVACQRIALPQRTCVGRPGRLLLLGPAPRCANAEAG